MSNLQIKSAGEGYDAIALGELMMRIDASNVPSERALFARTWYGSGQANVVGDLCACFGLKTVVVTTGVDDGIERSIGNRLREAAEGAWHITWSSTDDQGRFPTGAKGTLHSGMNSTWPDRTYARFVPLTSVPVRHLSASQPTSDARWRPDERPGLPSVNQGPRPKSARKSVRGGARVKAILRFLQSIPPLLAELVRVIAGFRQVLAELVGLVGFVLLLVYLWHRIAEMAVFGP